MRTHLLLLVSILALTVGLAVSAQNIAIPNTFSNNTVADAPQVNANFAALAANAVNRTGGTFSGTPTPTADNTVDLGSAALRFGTVYGYHGNWKGNTTLGDAAADTVTVNGTITSNLIATDNTYDIGAVGATRFRDLFLARNAVIGGTGTFGSGAVGAVAVGVGAATVGLYSSGANALDVATNGVKALGVDSTQFIDSPTQPRAVAYNSASQTISDNVETRVTYDSEEIDVGALHSTVTNTGRLTVPTGGAGLYVLFSSSVWAANATGYRYIYLLKNGTTTISPISYAAPLAAAGVTSAVMTVVVLADGDYVETWIRQTSGGNLAAGGAQPNDSRFTIVKLW